MIDAVEIFIKAMQREIGPYRFYARKSFGDFKLICSVKVSGFAEATTEFNEYEIFGSKNLKELYELCAITQRELIYKLADFIAKSIADGNTKPYETYFQNQLSMYSASRGQPEQQMIKADYPSFSKVTQQEFDKPTNRPKKKKQEKKTDETNRIFNFEEE